MAHSPLLILVILVAGFVGNIPASHGVVTVQFFEADPVVVGCALSQEKAESAIRAGAKKTGWAIKESNTNGVLLGYAYSRQTVLVTVQPQEKQIAIKYKSSTNMGYEVDHTGKPYIHRNYMKWTKSLRLAIEAVAKKECA
jgi:hypothetical protein